jgi:hypothetical protein
MVIVLWDKDHSAGFPDPTPGDVIGFYIQSDQLRPTTRLVSGTNKDVNIIVNREMFSFNKTLSGRISNNYAGNVILIAYNGDVRSLDFSTLDFNRILGYRTLPKTQDILDFNLPIFPFGQNLPIEHVWVLALFDKNGNNRPDAGESIGYHSTLSDSFPTLITIDDKNPEFVNIGAVIEIPQPSGHRITLSGHVDMVAGPTYNKNSKPLFIIVAKTNDPEILFSSPLSVIKAFSKLNPGENDFTVDLSATDLFPGDVIMVIALWDMDYNGGFPAPTLGDYVGYYQDKSRFQTSIHLTDGDNTLTLDHPEGQYFSVNRKVIAHNASIQFKLGNGGGVTLKKGDSVIGVAIQKSGVSGSYRISDIDYVIAKKVFTVTGNPDDTYTMNVLAAQLESILSSPFGISDVYVYAVLDKNANGNPDKGESAGYYWNWLLGFYYPKLTDFLNGVNVLDKSVIFTTNTF